MENASKALIIAGAILLSIIIISLGIMVVNNARNQIGGANLNSEEIQTFNSKWEAYIGDRKTAAEVKALCSSAIANNATEKAQGTARYITITGTDLSISEGTTTSTKVPAFSNLKTYTVKVADDGYTNGYITSITVTAN